MIIPEKTAPSSVHTLRLVQAFGVVWVVVGILMEMGTNSTSNTQLGLVNVFPYGAVSIVAIMSLHFRYQPKGWRRVMLVFGVLSLAFAAYWAIETLLRLPQN